MSGEDRGTRPTSAAERVAGAEAAGAEAEARAGGTAETLAAEAKVGGALETLAAEAKVGAAEDPGGTAQTQSAEERDGTAATLAIEATGGEEDPLRTIPRERYPVDGLFARGGIGQISRARDRHLGRPVALKELLRAGRGSAERRFVREALLTARLQHPGIVPIYEAGRWPSGEPFYAMKLVSGRALSDVIAATVGLDERLALVPKVLAVAEAVAYAHAQEVIHRDLKPANVLVGDYGETVVIDWGLAKDLRAGVEEDGAEDMAREPVERAGGLTVDGAVMGTPSYMAPEQAGGQPVDARADVYAIGAILYHLLTGAPPHEGESAMAILVKVIGEDPQPIVERQPGVPRDLAAIVEKALARDPAARYPSAKELADDLRRFQTGKLVAAHHYSARERLRRWARRNRTALTVAAIALVVMVVVVVTAFREVLHERNVATRRADELAIEQASQLAGRLPDRALELLAGVKDHAQWRRLRVIAADADAHGVPTPLLGHAAGISRVAFSPDGGRLVTTSDDCSLRLWDLRGGEHRVLVGHADQVWRAAFSPDGGRVASTSKDGTVRLWDAASGEPLRVFTDVDATRAVAFVDEGRRLITSNDQGELRAWDLESGASRRLTHCQASYFFTDGRRVGCVGSERRSVWIGAGDGSSERVLPAPEEPLGSAGAIARERDLVAVGGEDGDVRLWDLRSGALERLATGDRRLRVVAFSGDGSHLAAGSEEGSVHVWRTDTRERIHVLRGATSSVIRLEFSPDGAYLAAAAPEPLLHLWSLADGGAHPLAGLAEAAVAVAFSPDGRKLAGASVGGELRIWEPGALISRRLGGRSSGWRWTAFSPDAALVATGDAEGPLTLWSLDAGRPRVIAEGEVGVSELVFAAEGGRFAGLDGRGAVRVWDREGSFVAELALPGAPTHFFALTADGRRVAAASEEQVHVWDVEARTSRLLGAHTKKVRLLRLVTDGGGVLTGGEDSRVLLWGLEGEGPRVVAEHRSRIVALDASPDGALVLSGSEDHDIRVRELATDAEWTIPTQGLQVRLIVAHPDGRRAAVASRNNLISLWDLRERRLERELAGHAAQVRRIAFTADGTSMASLAIDGELRLWDLESGASRALPTGSGLVSFELSRDGRVILAQANETHELRLWRDELPRDADGFFAWLAATGRPIEGPPLPASAAAACPELSKEAGSSSR